MALGFASDKPGYVMKLVRERESERRTRQAKRRRFSGKLSWQRTWVAWFSIAGKRTGRTAP